MSRLLQVLVQMKLAPTQSNPQVNHAKALVKVDISNWNYHFIRLK